MQDSDRWRCHVKRELKRAGLQVVELPSGQKRIEGDRTFSQVVTLEDDARTEELARMVGGATVTETATATLTRQQWWTGW